MTIIDAAGDERIAAAASSCCAVIVTIYIHERSDWPHFRFEYERIAGKLSEVCCQQGRLLGRMEGLGFSFRAPASLQLPALQALTLQSLTEEVIKSSEIEGEKLDREQVRSSVARRLGVDIGALTPADHTVEGVVTMMLDGVQNHDKSLTAERLCGWQAALFPTGYRGMFRITVGAWRDDREGPMQGTSGPSGHERVHYQAPAAERLDGEMCTFLHWFNEATR